LFLFDRARVDQSQHRQLLVFQARHPVLMTSGLLSSSRVLGRRPRPFEGA
jgi:hypothetical protein